MALIQDPAWTAYDAAMRQYRLDVAAWEKSSGVSVQQQEARAAQVAALQAKAQQLTVQIATRAERIWDDNMMNVSWIEKSLQEGFGGLGELYYGLDPDPVKEARFYVGTFVTDWGEESAPGPVSDMLEPTQYEGGQVAPVAVPAGRNITALRVYRSNVGNMQAEFQYIGEVPLPMLAPADERIKNAELGEVLPSTTWLEPPVNLRGLVGVPNGIMAGFFDNTLCFSDPYHPYAWPIEYQITTEFPIVGLGVFGQTIFVGTTGNPYLVSGSDSASMSALKMEANQACSAARSIVSVQGGVLYASPDGLCLASGNGVQLVTSGVFTRAEWQALVPSSIEAAEHEGVYYFTHGGATPGTYAFDLPTRKLITVELQAKAFFVDRRADALYAVAGTSIVRVFGGTARRRARWRSGRAAVPLHAALAWVQANMGHKASAASPVYIRLRGDGWRIGMRGDLLEQRADGTLKRQSDGHVFAYEGENLRNQSTSALLLRGTPEFDRIHCTTKLQDNLPARLPPGRWREYEFEIESRERVTRITLAGSTQELQDV